MKQISVYLAGFMIVAVITAFTDDKLVYQPGLVAHYFEDPVNWGGNWPDNVSEPTVDPVKWTFTTYRLSRIEPAINHLFIRRGWFSVRWEGWIDVTPASDDKEVRCNVTGLVNLNPANSANNEFSLTLKDGTTITRDNLKPRFPDIKGIATSIILRPKGNSNDNLLMIDGVPYLLRNSETYKIIGDSEIFLYNDARNPAGIARGHWWLNINASNVLFFCSGEQVQLTTTKNNIDTYIFEMLADDGCRLYIDGKELINDWRACWEKLPRALRRSPPVTLERGYHKIVVEYFQGQSLVEGDSDPAKLYWSSISAGIPRQIVKSSHFTHTDAELVPPNKR
jgi:hypothetical protein